MYNRTFPKCCYVQFYGHPQIAYVTRMIVERGNLTVYEFHSEEETLAAEDYAQSYERFVASNPHVRTLRKNLTLYVWLY